METERNQLYAKLTDEKKAREEFTGTQDLLVVFFFFNLKGKGCLYCTFFLKYRGWMENAQNFVTPYDYWMKQVESDCPIGDVE